MGIHEDRYLIAAAVIMIFVPLSLAAYAYYFFSVTYAQQRSVEASQNWARIMDIKPGAHTPPKR